MCSLQRPLDTKTQIRVAVEAEAILNVIALWEEADLFLQPNKQIEERAQVFVNSGIKPLDALHLAFSVRSPIL